MARLYTTSFTSEEVYELRHGRGRALVIHNNEFKNSNLNRRGDEVDAETIKSLLGSMNFEQKDIKCYENGFAEDVKKFITDQSQDQELYNVDYLICFVMSHGKSGGNILGSGEKDDTWNLKHFGEVFNRENCKALKGKPKLFFIQACRGGDIEPNDEELCETDFVSGGTKTLPVKTDFFFAFASEEGYKCFRSSEHGSFFIQAICSLLKQHWKERSLSMVMTKVNGDIADKVVSYRDYEEGGKVKRAKQTANYRSSLRKEFFFSLEGMYFSNIDSPPPL